EAHGATAPRLRAERLADGRLGHLGSRHALVRPAERAPSRRRGLGVVPRRRALAVRSHLERRRRERAAGGGLPLPDFTNWRAGLTFTYRVFKLGLNYTDTSLSKEHCYVLNRHLR